MLGGIIQLYSNIFCLPAKARKATEGTELTPSASPRRNARARNGIPPTHPPSAAPSLSTAVEFHTPPRLFF